MKKRQAFILIAAAVLLIATASAFLLLRKSDQARAADFVREAKMLAGKGDYESAIIQLRNALKIAPSDVQIHRLLARNYKDAHKPQDSLKHFDAALRCGAADEPFLKEYACACIAWREFQELRKPAEKLLSLQDADADANLWMAMALEAERPTEAVSYAEKALSVRHDIDAYKTLARIQIRNADHAAAEATLTEALKQFHAEPGLAAIMALANVHTGKNDKAEKQIHAALAALETLEQPAKAAILSAAAEVYSALGKNELSMQILRQLVKLEPDNAAYQVSLAKRYAASRQFDEAASFLRESIKTSAQPDALRLFLVEVLVISGKMEEAQAEFSKLSAQHASTPYGQYLKGTLLLASGDAWKALQPLERATQDLPQLLHAKLALGICYWRVGRVSSAASEFEEVLKSDASYHDARAWLARCLFAQGDLPGAENLANQVLAANPANAEAQDVLLRCKAQHGDVEDVQRMMGKPATAPQAAQQALLLAQALASQGKLDDAANALGQPALAGSAEAAVMKARILTALSKNVEAEALLESFIVQHPASEPAAVEYAILLSRFGRAGAAQDVLIALTRRVPKSPAAHAALGDYYMTTGHADQAAASYIVAQQLDARDMTLRKRLVQALMQKNDLRQARAEIKTMKTDFGEVFDVLALEGSILLAEGKLEEALAYFNSLARRWPKEGEAPALVGLALLRKGDVPAAIASIEAARDVAPRDPWIRARLRDAYLAAGLYDKAVGEARQVLSLKPAAEKDVHQLAIGLAGARQSDQAVDLLQKLTAAAPGKADYHVQLAIMFAAEGNAPDAEREALAALNAEKTAATVSAACGVYWQIGKPDAARQLIEQNAANDPRLYHTLLARHFAVTRNLSKAEEQYQKLIRLAPNDSSLLAALGDFYASQPDRYDDAEQAYDKAIAAGAGSDYARKRKAVLLLTAGRLDDAERLLQKVAEKNAQDADSWGTLAEIALERMKYAQDKDTADAAAKRTADFVRRFPQLANAHYLQAVAELMRDEPGYVNAEASLGRALAIDPASVQARMLKARMLRDTGRFDESVYECRLVLKANPANTQAMLALGRALDRKGATIADYARLADEFPKNPAAKLLLAATLGDDAADRRAELVASALGDSPDWDITKGYSDLIAWKGRYDLAAKRLEAYANEHPHFIEGHRALAEVRTAAKDYPRAAESLRQAYLLSGRSQTALRRTVYMMVRANTIDDATALLHDHLKSRPKDTFARILLAQVLGQSGNAEKAVAELNAVLAKEPDNIEARLTLATAQMLQERYNDSLRNYERVLMNDPSNHIAANNAAYILADKLDRAMEGENLIIPAVQRYPKSAVLQETYGWVLYKLGKNDQAYDALQKSLHLEPKAPLAMYHMALVCKRLNKNDQAKDLLRKSLALDPNFDRAPEARKLLESLR